MRFALLILAVFMAAPVLAADRIAAPNGSGDACTMLSPCALKTALQQARSGDTVILKDGTYPEFITVRENVVIKAENRHKAIIKSGGDLPVRVKHSRVTIADLTIDGQKEVKPGLAITAEGGRSLEGIIIKNNHIKNTGMSGLKIGHGKEWKKVSNTKVLENLIENTGFKRNGECIYIGSEHSTKDKLVVDTAEIAYNICDGFTHNSVDLKPHTHNVEIHHNLFKNQLFRLVVKQKDRNEGVIVFRRDSSNHNIHHNIFRDITKPQGSKNDDGSLKPQPAVFHIATKSTNSKAHKVADNVVINVSKETQNAIRPRDDNKGVAETQIKNNRFCQVTNLNVLMPRKELVQLVQKDNQGLSRKRLIPIQDCEQHAAMIKTEIDRRREGRPLRVLSLVNGNTHVNDSGGQHGSHTVAKLWDGCLQQSPDCTMATSTDETFTIEFDFGQCHNLSKAKIFGDQDGNKVSRSWTLAHKVNQDDVWRVAFANQNVFGNQWFEQTLTDINARFAKVTIIGTPQVQARELEIHGARALCP